jgi:uncharacterized SAM-binding protein YcdF (DUF218 family)
MWRQPIKLILFLTLPISALIILSILYAPSYLNYADQPIKADAVVLFIGPDYQSRMRMQEARSLIAEGYANHLIIPAYDERPARKGAAPNYRRYYENTHIEALEAKRIMDRQGFRSALFVSSPGHMRRIRMIAGEVFDPAAYRIAFIPTRFEQRPEGIRKFTPTNVAATALECAKIIWFQTYRHWPANT